jgi:hypothetical protein
MLGPHPWPECPPNFEVGRDVDFRRPTARVRSLRKGKGREVLGSAKSLEKTREIAIQRHSYSSDHGLKITLEGDLAGMLSAARDSKRSPDTGDLLQIKLVAGARNKLYRQLCWAAA